MLFMKLPGLLEFQVTFFAPALLTPFTDFFLTAGLVGPVTMMDVWHLVALAPVVESVLVQVKMDCHIIYQTK